MNTSPNYALLLTATIDPGDYSSSLKRADVPTRLLDYETSLRFWLSFFDHRVVAVVFCENSNADVANLKFLANQFDRKTEFLSFSGNERVEGVHYGYSELGIIDYALKNSVLLGNAEYFIKVTGRLTCPSLSKLLDHVETDFDVSVDHRKKYKKERGFPLRARTQVMIFKKNFYMQHLYETRDEMVGRFSHIEEFLPFKLTSVCDKGKIIWRFPIEVILRGVGGSLHGVSASYGSLLSILKTHIRSGFRRYFPWVWL